MKQSRIEHLQQHSSCHEKYDRMIEPLELIKEERDDLKNCYMPIQSATINGELTNKSYPEKALYFTLD